MNNKTKRTFGRLLCLFALAVALVFMACQQEGGGIINEGSDTVKEDGSIISGIFTAAPVLAFTDEIPNGTVNDDGKVRFSFTAAQINNAPAQSSDNVRYAVYIAAGTHTTADAIIANYIQRYPSETGTWSSPPPTQTFQGTKDVDYTAVAVATKGDDRAVSAVRYAAGFNSEFNEAEGSGMLKSRGKAAEGGRTFYIDAGRGDDSNSGTHPRRAWKTLTRANNTVFQPGDHILLEVNSIWTGISTRNDNYIQFRQARGNGGMLAPQGSGTAEKPIVIDLYEYDEAVQTVYWSANQRPIINGNGTPSLKTSADGNGPYAGSGAIYLLAQHYWHIRNIEVTNSYEDFSDSATRGTHWYNREVPKTLLGIFVESTNVVTNCRGIVVENCYVHDVQSIHNNNGNPDGLYTSTEFGSSFTGNKVNGGIIVNVTESRVEGNIVKRVGCQGIRTFHGSGWGERIIFRGNYVENVAMDGMVMYQSRDSLIESNIVKNASAAPSLGRGVSAGNWAFLANNTVFQYNETYGTLYGNQDGEAWDIDDNCYQVIYQYNYSHHNAGGCCLFMGNQSNSVFRYNISVNDGSGSKWLDTVIDNMDTAAYPYLNYNRGQGLFHYSFGDLSASIKIPLIYNNTFYIGDGVDVALFDNTGATPGVYDKYVRFFNNIVLKAGTGTVQLGNNVGVGSTQYTGGRWYGHFRNNIFWAPNMNQFQSADTSQMSSMTSGGSGNSSNIWQDPKLKIQTMSDPEAVALFRTQVNDVFRDEDSNDPEELKRFTGITKLRMRASHFSPESDSPAIGAGMVIPVGNAVSELDGAWNSNAAGSALSSIPSTWSDSNGLTKDFFGNDVNYEHPPIGAAAGPYTP